MQFHPMYYLIDYIVIGINNRKMLSTALRAMDNVALSRVLRYSLQIKDRHDTI